jgi:hypothetical protein
MAATTMHGAAALGRVTPGCDNARWQAGVEGNRKAGSGDCAAKALATLQARAAMAGVQVDPIEADDGRHVFIVSRWNLTRQCDALDDLRGLLQRMGVAS